MLRFDATPRRSITAFTLIELLIVVAIIAILAAIAVPNFLEAQVRSKVSRSMADMRSIATAIESYAVDFNRPPLGIWEMNILYTPAGTRAAYGARGNENMGDPQAYRIFGQLTTPVAYMTAVPTEIFLEKGASSGGANPNAYYRKSYTYQASSTLSINGYVADATTGFSTNNSSIIGMNRLGKSWMLATQGPQRNLGGGPAKAVAEQPDSGTAYNQLGYPGLFYDPTNGTVSFGYIIRSSAGIEPARKI